MCLGALPHATHERSDGLFDKFDLDGGGTLDLKELKHSIRMLLDSTSAANAQHEHTQDRAGYCKRRIGALAQLLPRALDMEAAAEGWRAQRDSPPMDARLGQTIKSAIARRKGRGQSGASVGLNDVASKWDVDGSGRMDELAFRKQVMNYKNMGDVRIEGRSAEVTAQIDELFESLRIATADEHDGGAIATGANDGHASAPTLHIMAALEKLMAAAADHEEIKAEMAEELEEATAAARRMQTDLESFDGAEKAAFEAKADQERRAQEAIEARHNRAVDMAGGSHSAGQPRKRSSKYAGYSNPSNLAVAPGIQAKVTPAQGQPFHWHLDDCAGREA